jgi:phosphoenolpyruvate-protein kinase (PTS system EI component)
VRRTGPGLRAAVAPELRSSLPADIGKHDPHVQQQRLESALEQVRGEIHATLEHARQRQNTDEEEIFAAHLALLEDPALLDAASTAIEHGSAATHAWSDRSTCSARYCTHRQRAAGRTRQRPARPQATGAARAAR